MKRKLIYDQKETIAMSGIHNEERGTGEFGAHRI